MRIASNVANRAFRASCLLTVIAMAVPDFAKGEEKPAKVNFGFSDQAGAGGFVEGLIFADHNRNGIYDAGIDKPASGVNVSDGLSVAASDPNGRYKLPIGPQAKYVFICKPAHCETTGTTCLPLDTINLDAQDPSAKESRPSYDFALYPAKQPDAHNFQFVMATDLHLENSESGSEALQAALATVSGLKPAPAFLAITGGLVSKEPDLYLFDTVKLSLAKLPIPTHVVPGIPDLGRGEPKLDQWHSVFGPDYYSTDYGQWHFIFLNTENWTKSQETWLGRDTSAAGKDKRIIVFQNSPPDMAQSQRLQKLNARAVFSGGYRMGTITNSEKGMVSINQPPLLSGGFDGSPAGYRLVTVTGDQLNTEHCSLYAQRQVAIVHPQGDLSGPQRIVANVFDTSGTVKSVRFRLELPGNRPFAEGELKQVSPLSWMVPLDAQRLGVAGGLPPQFKIKVMATGSQGTKWESSTQVMQRMSPAPVALGPDWRVFMGNAQRTGRAAQSLAPPLRLNWATPTHGTIDIGGPVLFKGVLAVPVKDRDNLISNGVMGLDAKTGQQKFFCKTDSGVHHCPAFAEDTADGPGLLYAVSAAGTIYMINPEDGHATIGRLQTGEFRDWVFSSPAAQGKLVVAGNTGMLMAMHAFSGDVRWRGRFDRGDVASFASPSLAGEVLVMAGNWMKKDGKPVAACGLDVTTGQNRWVVEGTGSSGSVAVYSGRGVYVGNDGTLRVINLENGNETSRKELSKDWSLASPAIDPEVTIASAGGVVSAFATDTFNKLWEFKGKDSICLMAPGKSDKTPLFSSAVIAGQYVYIGCTDGRLYALSKKSGSVAWQYNFGVPVLSTPCISGNTLFITALDGNVYAFTAGAAIQS